MKPITTIVLTALICLGTTSYAQNLFNSQRTDFFVLNVPDLAATIGSSSMPSGVDGAGNVNYNSTTDDLYMTGVYDLTAIGGSAMGCHMIYTNISDADEPISAIEIGNGYNSIVVAEQANGLASVIEQEPDYLKLSAGDLSIGASFVEFGTASLHFELHDYGIGQSSMVDMTSANGFVVRSVEDNTGAQAFGVINHALTNLFTIRDDGNVAIGTTPMSTYLLTINGSVWAAGVYTSSDVRYKTNIKPIDNALDKVMRLNGVTYTYRADEINGLNFSNKPQIGFIAQELEQILPEVVAEDDKGYRAVNYANITAILAQAIKEDHTELETFVAAVNEQMQEKDAQIEVLQNELTEIRNTLAGNTQNNNTQQVDIVGLGDASFIQQNTPNPFTNKTAITYFVNTKTDNAQITITDLSGRNIKTIDVAAGKGQIELNFSDFPAGVLVYSLYVNNQLVGSKQMIRE